jgi:transposase
MNATATTNATATAGTILALDLGKYKSVACLYQRPTAQGSFQPLDTSYANLHCLFEQHRPGLVVFEACALAGWVHDLCTELGLPCKVANTASQAWKFKHTKRKTDKDDALRLAQLEALSQLPTAVVPPKQTREWRGLIACRQDLIGRRVALQNRIRALLVSQGLPAPRGHRAWTEAGLHEIAGHARPLAECGVDELWRGLLELALIEYRHLLALLKQVEARLDALAKADAGVRILESIPGVGARTAEVIVAYLGEPKRFQTAKQVSAYGGLVPRQYQSGESDRRGRITRRTAAAAATVSA